MILLHSVHKCSSHQTWTNTITDAQQYTVQGISYLIFHNFSSYLQGISEIKIQQSHETYLMNNINNRVALYPVTCVTTRDRLGPRTKHQHWNEYLSTNIYVESEKYQNIYKPSISEDQYLKIIWHAPTSLRVVFHTHSEYITFQHHHSCDKVWFASPL